MIILDTKCTSEIMQELIALPLTAAKFMLGFKMLMPPFATIQGWCEKTQALGVAVNISVQI